MSFQRRCFTSETLQKTCEKKNASNCSPSGVADVSEGNSIYYRNIQCLSVTPVDSLRSTESEVLALAEIRELTLWVSDKASSHLQPAEEVYCLVIIHLHNF